MRHYRGFVPYKKMLDSGELSPGQNIIIGHLEYEVVARDRRRKSPYRVRGGFGSTTNAEDFLKDSRWSVKEDSPV